MPFVSDSQRRWMFANEPEMAKEWASHTPKGAKLPEHVKKAFARGSAAALAQFGFKGAAEEIRLKIPTRKFHGWDAAFKDSIKGKKANETNDATADVLADMLNKEPTPKTPLTGELARDHLDRTTAWGAPSNMAGGDAGSRVSDMGQNTSFGGV